MGFFSEFLNKRKKSRVMKNILSGKIDTGIKNEIQKPDIDKWLQEKRDNIVVDLYHYILKISSYGKAMNKLNEPQKNLYYNRILEDEVNNGGFYQYFINSSGEYAHETVLSLKKIGANKTVSILQKAINQFPGSKVPKDEDMRIKATNKIAGMDGENWNELDNKFYDYDELMELNLQYVKNNIESFRF